MSYTLKVYVFDSKSGWVLLSVLHLCLHTVLIVLYSSLTFFYFVFIIILKFKKEHCSLLWYHIVITFYPLSPTNDLIWYVSLQISFMLFVFYRIPNALSKYSFNFIFVASNSLSFLNLRNLVSSLLEKP